MAGSKNNGSKAQKPGADNEDDNVDAALDAVDDDEADDEDFNPGEYDAMLRLEQLESLEEEMQELGVKTLDEVRARIADLHRQLDQQGR